MWKYILDSSSPSHQYSSFTRVPRPMICLNSVIEPIERSRTTSLHVCASTPVLMSRLVTAMTG